MGVTRSPYVPSGSEVVQSLPWKWNVQGLRLAEVDVDRKILADLAVNDTEAFAALVKVAKDALPEDVNAPASA